MSDIWGRIFGNHPTLLRMCDERSKWIANNLANQDTPGYLAVDVDFKAVLGQMQSQTPVLWHKTDAKHLGPDSLFPSGMLQYRQPVQPGLDNTVDGQVEQAKYVENSLHYALQLNALNHRLKNVMLAIKGG